MRKGGICMTVSGHVAVTGLTLQYTNDLRVVVAMNMALHLLLDMVPHAEWSTFREDMPKAVLITAVDLLVSGWYIVVLFQRLDKPWWFITTGIVSGLWLDILTPFSSQWFPALHRLHLWTHSWPLPPDDPIDWSKTITGPTPVWCKLLIQTLCVLIPYRLLPK